MKREYLANPYDAVKRLWHDLLEDWAPLFAEPCFIPDELRRDYETFIGIPVLPPNLPDDFSVLNDPDIGIRLPKGKNQAQGLTHIRVSLIIEQLRGTRAKCVITYDQSFPRRSQAFLKEQRRSKMQALADEQICCFYYVSQVPFLFATRTKELLKEVREILTDAGIPEERLESI